MKRTYYAERHPVRKIPTRAAAVARRQAIREEEDPRYYGTRLPTSARRYHVSPEEVYQHGNTRLHVRYADVPKRKSRQPQLPPQQQRDRYTDEVEAPGTSGEKSTRNIHPMLYLGVGMLAMFALFLLLSSAVTAAQTCRAVAYNEAAFQARATDLLAQEAGKQLGTGYSLFGNTHVSVTTSTVSDTTKPHVFLAFSASGTWVYGLSKPAKEQITHLLAGKTTQEAAQLLAALPGVEQVAIRLTGFADETRLPKQSSLIHLVFTVI